MSYIRLTLGEKFGIVTFLVWLLCMLLGVIGWIMNIMKIVPLLDGGFTPWLIGRLVGIPFFPLGAVLGWF